MKLARSIAFCALLIPASLPAQAQDDADRGFVQRTIEDALSGDGRKVRITGFQGALSSTATLKELTISDAEGVWLTLSDAQLDWRRAALLRGRLELDSLTAASVTLTRLPSAQQEPEQDEGFALPSLPPPEATQFSLPELPVSIQIGEVRIDRVSISEPVFGEAAVVSMTGSASLAEGEGAVDLNIARIDERRGTFVLDGSYANSTEILSLSFVLSEDADGIVANLIDLPDRPPVDLRIEGEGPLSDFIAQIALQTEGVDRLSGAVELGTTQSDAGLSEQMFSAQLAGDIRPLLQPDYRSFFGSEVSLDIRALRSDQGGLDINRLALNSAALNINGQITLDPEAWPQRIDLRASITPPEGESVLLSIPGPETRLDRANLTFAFDAAQGDEWRLDLLVDTLTRDGFALGGARMSGNGTISTGDGVAIGQAGGDIALDLTGLDLGDEDLTRAVGSALAASFTFALQEDAPFRLSNLDLSGGDYGLTGDVQVDLPEGSQSPVITSDLTLTASDLSRFAAVAGQTISGAVRVDVTGDVTPLDSAFDLEIAGTSEDLAVGLSQVDPLIAGVGSLDVKARRDATGTYLDLFDIATPQSEISGNASLTTGKNSGEIDALLKDASIIHPDMSGQGRLAVVFDQEGTAWNADLSASLPGDTQAKVTVRTPQETGVTRLSGTMSSGDLSQYAWALDRPVAGGVDLQLQGEGDIGAQTGAVRLEGTATDLVLEIVELDTMLSGAAGFVLDARRDAAGVITVNTLSVDAPRLKANVSGSVSPDRSRIEYSVDIPNIGVLVAALPGAVSSQGRISSDGGDWQIDSQLQGPAGMEAAVAGSLAQDASRGDLTVTGAAPLALANARLSPNIAEGLLRFDLGLNGPLELNSVSGTLSTNGALMSLPGQKIGLQPIDSTITLSGGRAQTQVSLGVSSGGQVQVSGPITLSAPFSGDLTIVLQQVGLIEPGLYETKANGQLSVSGPLTGGARIAGQIVFDEIGVQVPSTSGASSAALPGLIHVNESEAGRRTRDYAGLIPKEDDGSANSNAPPYQLDVLISAPSRIFIRGRGLDAEMGGELRLRGNANQVVPSGRFNLIRGRLNILGQRVDLTEGYIEPQGDLAPFMRIVAAAQAGSTDVIFTIEGEVSEPKLTITSNPELPDDEILSRFLFGRDLTQISTLQALQIADALATLTGGGTGVFGRVREGLGLDDLDVSTTDTGETTVRAGKYLTENIYSDISSSTDGETEINLNLTLSPSLTARGTTRSDNESSIGIFLEKDY